ncbi:MAG: rRNA maturation RNase YbeY [Patescibacteria group bacterium]
MEKNLKTAASAVLTVLKQSGVCLEIYLAGGQRMLSLNKKFRGKNKAADVLSFNEPKSFISGQSHKPLGEIFLNVAKTCKSDKSYGDYMAYLLIHGILHLLGYNHIKKNDIIKMERKERQLLNKI